MNNKILQVINIIGFINTALIFPFLPVLFVLPEIYSCIISPVFNLFCTLMWIYEVNKMRNCFVGKFYDLTCIFIVLGGFSIYISLIIHFSYVF